jgi:cyclase
MVTKRIIPCLDIKDGRTVKGMNFVGLRDAGDPVELAVRYAAEGADELVFLDITATVEKRKTLIDLVARVSRSINIPFTVGGGVNSAEDVQALLQCGADKISVNSAAFRSPQLITEMAQSGGRQCVVLAIDAKREKDGDWYVYLDGGRTATGRKAVDWAREGIEKGAGEILLTSMDHDGTGSGFAIDITSEIAQFSVPVIASGGGGSKEHFVAVFQEGKADAALAAGIFHFGEVSIPDLKHHLKEAGIHVRI